MKPLTTAASQLHHIAAVCECMASHCLHVAPDDPLAAILSPMLSQIGDDLTHIAHDLAHTPDRATLRPIAQYLRDSGPRIAAILDPALVRTRRRKKTRSQ